MSLKNHKLRQAAFDGFRRKGIFLFNKKQLKEPSPKFKQERSSKKEDCVMVMCGQCLGFFDRLYFFRHICKEHIDAATYFSGISVDLLDTYNCQDELCQDFKNNVLPSIRDGEVKNLIMKDKYFLVVGSRLYNKIKRQQGKEMDAIKVIRADLRRLSHIYRIFLQHSPSRIHQNLLDMFERTNFEELREAINEYTVGNGDNIKCGLKHILHYTIKFTAIILKGTFLCRERDDLSLKIDQFLAIYALNKEEMFGDALYQLNKKQTS